VPTLTTGTAQQLVSTGTWHYINSIGLCCCGVRALGNGEMIKVNMIPIDQRSPWLLIFPLSLTTTVSVNSGFITLCLGNCIAYMPFDILNGRQNLQGFTLHHSSHRMIMLTESMSLCPWLVALYIICFSFY
jgi:hypothetical protein